MNVEKVIGNFKLETVQNLVDNGFIPSIINERDRFKVDNGYLAKHKLITLEDAEECGIGCAVALQFGVEEEDVFSITGVPEKTIKDEETGETLYFVEDTGDYVPFVEYMNWRSENFDALIHVINEKVAPALNNAIDTHGGKLSFEFNFKGLAWVYTITDEELTKVGRLAMN
jgi:hypothetical protein